MHSRAFNHYWSPHIHTAKVEQVTAVSSGVTRGNHYVVIILQLHLYLGPSAPLEEDGGEVSQGNDLEKVSRCPQNEAANLPVGVGETFFCLFLCFGFFCGFFRCCVTSRSRMLPGSHNRTRRFNHAAIFAASQERLASFPGNDSSLLWGFWESRAQGLF